VFLNKSFIARSIYLISISYRSTPEKKEKKEKIQLQKTTVVPNSCFETADEAIHGYLSTLNGVY